jgi:putative PIN family toxin of toxin-antitoxin system
MIRVVLDTNILISALLSPQGQPAQVFLMTILDPETQPCVSADIFAEYEEVIRRPDSTAAIAKLQPYCAQSVMRAFG